MPDELILAAPIGLSWALVHQLTEELLMMPNFVVIPKTSMRVITFWRLETNHTVPLGTWVISNPSPHNEPETNWDLYA